ncbi:DUF3096 domain-containing protein [Desulfurococcus mucosus]|uniref:DUF3096 domain-containing protein n=1 Tax=Desulfurococcus mucosus (strain ATCC 35584 / DSM 2162 / JCM 9187 / O7/1) TaxID=765177 RepID=E8R9Z3_DESM0|nr:DUF3096 domain-containing protein [Desulfurococcus mucosus]ADV65319.1 hypothetical protein Desmu_1017 [Desulfurococcus mucosus DSM 2162]
MAEEKLQELMKKYLGVSVPRLFAGVLMLVFGLLILVLPELLNLLIAAYLIIEGLLVIIDEYVKSRITSTVAQKP